MTKNICSRLTLSYFLIHLSLALFTVIEYFSSDFFAACAAVRVTFSNAFSQSVLFRVHEGINILGLISCLRLLVILLLVALVK